MLRKAVYKDPAQFYQDEVQGKVKALKSLQAETAAELEALLPAVLDRAFRGNCGHSIL